MFVHTFLLVFIAEMADKTQLMVMALTNKYRAKNVAIGMTLGVFAISALSVLAGDIISGVIPLWIIQLCAACLFILFGMTTLLSKEEADDHRKYNFRFPILSIAGTFLLAELGDKTQLTTVALAANNSGNMIPIFVGASLGLILANIIGIFAGKFIFSKLSEVTVKIASSFFFLFFGSLQMLEIFPYHPLGITLYSFLLIFIAYRLFMHSQKRYLH
ncbi:MAG: TMEM165/GDT1 family protein [Erysipelotrichaceae bacterium]|nr:TMEM165/GDT1 family protein [Erysipelotrichaceae bacterium]